MRLFFAHKMESGCKIFASVSLCFRDSAGSLWGLTAWHHTYFPCLAYDSGSYHTMREDDWSYTYILEIRFFLELKSITVGKLWLKNWGNWVYETWTFSSRNRKETTLICIISNAVHDTLAQHTREMTARNALNNCCQKKKKNQTFL